MIPPVDRRKTDKEILDSVRDVHAEFHRHVHEQKEEMGVMKTQIEWLIDQINRWSLVIHLWGRRRKAMFALLWMVVGAVVNESVAWFFHPQGGAT